MPVTMFAVPGRGYTRSSVIAISDKYNPILFGIGNRLCRYLVRDMINYKSNSRLYVLLWVSKWSPCPMLRLKVMEVKRSSGIKLEVLKPYSKPAMWIDPNAQENGHGFNKCTSLCNYTKIPIGLN